MEILFRSICTHCGSNHIVSSALFRWQVLHYFVYSTLLHWNTMGELAMVEFGQWYDVHPLKTCFIDIYHACDSYISIYEILNGNPTMNHSTRTWFFSLALPGINGSFICFDPSKVLNLSEFCLLLECIQPLSSTCFTHSPIPIVIWPLDSLP